MADYYYRCDDCGRRLQPYTAEDGHYVALREQDTRSRLKFGWVLCPECQKKEKYSGNEKGPIRYRRTSRYGIDLLYGYALSKECVYEVIGNIYENLELLEASK